MHIKRFGIHLAVLVVLLVVPWVFGDYGKFLASEILIYGLFALSFEILYGHTGMLSFGQAGFFGTGAYVVAILAGRLDWDLLTILAMTILWGLALSSVVGLFAIRLRGHYFALITLVVGVILYYWAMGWRALTGAEDGISFVRPQFLGTLELDSPVSLYYFTLFWAIICYVTVVYVLNGSIGRMFRGIRANEERMMYVGYEPGGFKLLSFCLSGTLAAFAGGLYAILVGYTNVDSLFWILSGDPVLWTIIGGAGTIVGPILGAAALTLVREYLSSAFISAYPLLVGIFLIGTIVFFPKGIVGEIQRRVSRR